MMITQKVKIPLSTKFVLTFVPLFLFAMLMTIYAVHRTVTLQYTERYERDLHSSTNAIDRELSTRQESIKTQLRQLAVKIRDDHEFRLYVSVLDDMHHTYIVDYAPMYMTTMGLHALEIIDANGTVLSSGQYRQAFGGNAIGLIRNIQNAEDDVVLVWFDHPDGYKLCLTALQSFTIGDRLYYIIGGTKVDEDFLGGLQTNTRNVLLLRTPTTSLSSAPDRIEPGVLDEIDLTNGENILPAWLRDEYSFSHLPIPVVDRNTYSAGGIYLLHSRSELVQLLSTLNEKIIAITVVGIIFVVILAFWQAGNVALPLKRLANRAANISLDSLYDNFNIKTRDEVGILNDALKSMVQRLRISRLELAVAEQKAAFAEIARKVNHDIKNGFIPIRNVMQHWSEVADNDPDALVKVFKERRETIDESLQYLQELARNYAQSDKKFEVEPVNVYDTVDTVIRNYQDLPGKHITLEFNNSDEELFVPAEPHQLRRAIENIICNAVEACDVNGRVTVSTSKQNNSIVICIKDTGKGIPSEIKDKLFHTPVTTKTDGTGIGLMNAHTIVKGFGGTITIEEPTEEGTQVCITLPELQEALSNKDQVNEDKSL